MVGMGLLEQQLFLVGKRTLFRCCFRFHFLSEFLPKAKLIGRYAVGKVKGRVIDRSMRFPPGQVPSVMYARPGLAKVGEGAFGLDAHKASIAKSSMLRAVRMMQICVAGYGIPRSARVLTSTFARHVCA